MDELLKEVNKLYGLKLNSFEPVDKGFLTENHILFGNHEKYFLKRYRFNKKEKIEEIHLAKKYFADNGIPVVLPILNTENNTFFFFDDGYFALFPFIDERWIKNTDISDTAITSLGEMLAKIHLAGKDATVKVEERFKGWDKEKMLAKNQSLTDLIEQKNEKDDFDKLALEDLRMRKSLMEANTIMFEDLGLQNDHLIHGDYVAENVFFDESDHVSHVFDFEKVAFAPRVFELVRSLIFMFFSNDLLDAHKAKLYLKSYSNIYPISDEMLRTGLKLYYLRMLYSSWIPNEHYLNNNFRVDHFLASSSQSVRYLSENLGELENGLFD